MQNDSKQQLNNTDVAGPKGPGIETGAVLIKVVLLVVLGAFLFFVYNRADAKDVSLAKIDKALHQKTDIEQMNQCDERDLMQFLGLDANQFDSFLYYKSKESLGVDEVVIIKVKNRADIAAVQDAVQTRIDSQIKAFESYGPEQVKMLKNAVVRTKGNYLFYGTAKDPDQYEEVLLNAI